MRRRLNIGNLSLILESSWGKNARSTLASITADAVEPGFTLGIGLWGIFALFISLEGWVIHRFMPSRTMTAGIHYIDGLLMLYGWTTRDESQPGDRRHSIDIPDLLWGRSSYSTEVLGEYRAMIPMPEGNYPAQISLVRCTWSRPRWAEVRITQRAEINLERSIPIPGKGEWNLDDDGIESLTVPAQSLADAISYVVKSALRDRERYGGSIAWLPAGASMR